MDNDTYRHPIDREAARRFAEMAGLVVLDPADAKWLCGLIHGEFDCVDYDRVHELLEGTS